jgi:hypothetical protein
MSMHGTNADVGEGPQIVAAANKWILLRPVWDFFIHISCATCIFVLLALPAIFLNCTLDHMRTICSQIVVVALQIAEYSMLGADLTLFLVFLVKTTWRAAKAI